jgi:histidinol-phosphate aminotransferase
VRLHLNENTAGCSPAVLATLRALGRGDAGDYPDYEDARAAVARHFDVPLDHVLLTNGLDEGILAAVGAAFRDRGAAPPETLGVAPAFDMYEACTTALGGRMAAVPLGPQFELDIEALRRAVGPATRIVFLTNPHNPSGRAYPLETFRTLARAIAPIPLFVDEAYADFCGTSLIDAETFASQPNLIVGRTFSKSYGLAGLRAGAVVASPSTLEPIRRVVPPYSLNRWAAAALPAAIEDRAYRDWYCAQAAASRAMLADACARLGVQTWPSSANFVLVQVGPRASSIVRLLAERGVLVRDRSSEAGCEGCIRVTAGLVEDTRRAVGVLEEVLCAAR